ncbi:hypothetical protein ACIHCQ_25075 [Streptomyces sp. NPDC052236]|uniref:hypothetical protein n=1 Tax=Streptomyces sp. NPDC052236 TaxID=3365686 RepID=UPI0037CFBA51
MRPMRLRNALAVLAALAVLVGTAGAAAGTAAADTTPSPSSSKPAGPPESRQPICGKVTDPEFPLDTRIHGGPAVQHSGGGFEEWSLDLANTTAQPCTNIHPVIIFTGRDGGLAPPRMALEFYDGQTARWRPVALETTAEDEIVGVLDDGFPGFAVPARKTVTVRVRVAMGADIPSNEVTVNAAIVQRQGDDGDWVGESGDYRFAVVDQQTAEGEETEEDGPGSDATDAATDAARDELATTGTGSLIRLGVAIGAVLLSSGALVLVSRRLRARRH